MRYCGTVLYIVYACQYSTILIGIHKRQSSRVDVLYCASGQSHYLFKPHLSSQSCAQSLRRPPATSVEACSLRSQPAACKVQNRKLHLDLARRVARQTATAITKLQNNLACGEFCACAKLIDANPIISVLPATHYGGTTSVSGTNSPLLLCIRS